MEGNSTAQNHPCALEPEGEMQPAITQAEQAEIISHIDAVAIRKAGVIGWKPYYYKRIGDDGVLIKGGIPRVLKSGPRKGSLTWDGCAGESEVFVTDADIRAQESTYESITSNCSECFGSGKTLFGWSKDAGKRYRECGKCYGSGRMRDAVAKGNEANS